MDVAKAVLNCSSSDILTGTGPGPTFLQAEQVASWPANFPAEEED